MMCNMDEVLKEVNVKTGRALLYTNDKGLRQKDRGDSFYVWTKWYAGLTDIAMQILQKDLAEDVRGDVYCADGIDVIVVERLGDACQ